MALVAVEAANTLPPQEEVIMDNMKTLMKAYVAAAVEYATWQDKCPDLAKKVRGEFNNLPDKIRESLEKKLSGEIKDIKKKVEKMEKNVAEYRTRGYEIPGDVVSEVLSLLADTVTPLSRWVVDDLAAMDEVREIMKCSPFKDFILKVADLLDGKSGSVVSLVDDILKFVKSPEFPSFLREYGITEEEKTVLIKAAPALADLFKSLINHATGLARSFVAAAIMDGQESDIKIKIQDESKKVSKSAEKLQTDMEETLPGIVKTLPGVIDKLNKTRMTKGRIALIVVGCVAGVLLVGIVVYCFCCKSKPKSQLPASPPVGNATNASNPGSAAHASNPRDAAYRA